jgi:dipeptidyl aminopeptidase/acylaminoacyl peptidase
LPGFLAIGSIVVADSTEVDAKLQLLTSKELGFSSLSGVPSFYEGISSPNGEWLAYISANDQPAETWVLVVVSAGGQVSFSKSLSSLVPWDPSLGFRFKWLDNQQVIVKDPQFGSVTFSIINPFTLQRQQLTLELPDLFAKDPDHLSKEIAWGAAPDPTLTRAAYLRRRVDPVADWYNLVLWDLETGKELWVLNKGTTQFTEPVWSPDGGQLAVVALNEGEDNYDRFELFIVSRDGQAQKWVDIKGYYPDALSGRLKWSPNGRYIAFTLKWGGRPLLILDTQQKEVLDFCISGGASHSDVIWSPDSTQLILPRQSEPFIVIDLERRVAAQIVPDANFRPVGWLVDPPVSEATATSTPTP